jgi:hypothetical protein
MTELSKFSDLIKNASTAQRSKIMDDIRAAAPSLPIADLKVLNKALTEVLAADAAKNSRKALRLQKLQAAMASDDRTVETRIDFVRGELKRLGYDINASAKDGIDAMELHKKAKTEGWRPERITALKIESTNLGLME